MSRILNARSQHNPDPNYACTLIQELRKKGYTLARVARLTGLHERTLYRVMEVGFKKFPMQFILEALAGHR